MLMPMGVAAMVAAAAGAPQWLAAVPAGQRPARLCMSSTFAITVILVVVIIRIVLGHRKGDAAAQWFAVSIARAPMVSRAPAFEGTGPVTAVA
mmetsp:Transcript_31074/g.80928  ORF Transcript_31074/g.80928 Transcript_31074/m.80928 type:complete len:93 (+) Transcript_31074:2452-2730(+)